MYGCLVGCYVVFAFISDRFDSIYQQFCMSMQVRPLYHDKRTLPSSILINASVVESWHSHCEHSETFVLQMA